MDVDEEKDADKDDPEEQARKEAVESITAAADQLMTRGQDEVYEAERELLIRQYKRETGEDWKDDSRSGAQGPSDDAATSQWEYQWADARDGGEIHGPYAGTEMAAWTGAGYFGEGVQFRQAPAGLAVWGHVKPLSEGCSRTMSTGQSLDVTA
ncbi:hypothetical protein FH972_026073 [Carpinus fangiana]|uniref:GYF domain-containing protein n=1 Tax=Carpinus fangiana TaxID=176857 RepID=A0A5N6L390_9ROSI|nr:hypothetical protein FH972_026073 [Carpinus fangiana]